MKNTIRMAAVSLLLTLGVGVPVGAVAHAADTTPTATTVKPSVQTVEFDTQGLRRTPRY